MSGYAVQNSGLGWRAINAPGDVGPDEYYSYDQPPPTEPPPPTLEKMATSARQFREQLLSTAALTIGPLQDAVDTDSATADELERLKLWKLYRIGLIRIEQQPGFPVEIRWPSPPQAPTWDGLP